MVFNVWQIGLEIHQEALRVIAVQRQKQGWQLRHWWLIPLPENTFLEGVLHSPENLIQALSPWRRELPLRHQLRVAFPSQRTLQRSVPAPDNRLAEPDREIYLATAAARQLQMLPGQLSWDYTATPHEGNSLLVTAARRREVDVLIKCLAKLRLFPVALTPDACVLPVLGGLCHPEKPRFLVHQESDHWLWANTEEEARWGWVDARQSPTFHDVCQHLTVQPKEVAFSSALSEPTPQGAIELDAWRALVRLHPPLPPQGGSFTVAIGLATGKVNR